MKVLFVPHSDTDPYLSELADGLADHGISVVDGDPGDRLPVTQSMADEGIPDVVHLHRAESLLDGSSRIVSVVLALWLLLDLGVARLLGARVVWTVHSLSPHETAPAGVARLFRRVIAATADRIITHSHGGRERVVDSYPSVTSTDVRIVPHGNYVDTYENAVRETTARERLDLPTDATVFLYFGTIGPSTPVEGLVETFVETDTGDSHLVVAGRSVTDAATLELLHDDCRRSDRVHTDLQLVPDEAVQLYMSAADVMVFPSERPLTSARVILAMSFATPVVAPRRGTVPDTLAPATDLLYDPDEDDSLANALEWTADAELTSLERRTYSRASEFGWAMAAGRTTAVYYEVVDDEELRSALVVGDLPPPDGTTAAG